MSSEMSVMLKEAISSNITKILSLENVKICPFDKMHPIQPNEIFFKYHCGIYWPRVEAMFFEKFDHQCATGMTFKWLTLAKVDQISTKIKGHFKNMEKV